MAGRVRIKREPGVVGASDGRPIYIPQGARFVAANDGNVVASITTAASATIDSNESEVLVAATIEGVGTATTDEPQRQFRQSFSSSDASAGKPQGACDWKEACLIASPAE